MKKQKKFLVQLLVFLTIILSSCQSFAVNISDYIGEMEFSESYQEYLKAENKKELIAPRMFEIPVNKTATTNPLKLVRMLGSTVDADYSLVDVIPENVIVRDQKQTNSCWAFSSLAVLETTLALKDYKAGFRPVAYDFSERHMEYATSQSFLGNAENPNGFYREVGDGGLVYLTIPYLTNGMGAIADADMPFENNEDDINISEIQGKKVITQVNDAILFPSYKGVSDTTLIRQQMKEHIKNYGAITAGIYGASVSTNSAVYNYETGAIYCDSSYSYPINHAVTIVGWDDDYAVENFVANKRPSAPGAWIIKNSWGTGETLTLAEMKQFIYDNFPEAREQYGWTSPEAISDEDAIYNFSNWGYVIDENNVATLKVGNNGFMYISYEDANVYSQLDAIQDADNSVSYENIYQYDEFGGAIPFGFNVPTIYLAAEYDKASSGSEYLTQVGIYASEAYTCKVFVNPNGASKAMSDLQQIELTTGETATFDAGYHTLKFAEPLKLNSDKFAVVFEITGAQPDSMSVMMEFNYPEMLGYDGSVGEIWGNVEIAEQKCFWTVPEAVEANQWFATSDTLFLTEGNWPNFDATIKAFTTSQIVESIRVKTPPTKTTYYVGDNFDATGMVVEEVYASGEAKTITDYTVLDGTQLGLGQDSVTITYKGFSTTQPITVIENVIENVEITTAPTKTEYWAGEDFDSTGMVIEAVYTDGSRVVVTDYTVVDGNTLKNGQTSVTIQYQGFTLTQPITVIENAVEEIEITTAPSKVDYIAGQNFDTTGMVVEATYTNGNKRAVTGYTVENGTNLQAGQTEVTITFEGKSATQAITVIEKVETSISVKTMPAKTKYIQNKEELDLAGGVIEIAYNDGNKEDLAMTSSNITATGFDNTILGTQKITLTYKNKTTQFNVEIIELPKPENSNFDDAEGDVKSIKAYYYTDKSKEEYSKIKVEISNMVKAAGNEKMTYFYHLSSTPNAENISDWVEINKVEETANGIAFEINTSDVTNHEELVTAEKVYLYVREVATRNGMKAEEVTPAMALEVKDIKIEEYVDDVKKSDVPSEEITNPTPGDKDNNNSAEEDKTKAPGSIPKAGEGILMICLAIALVVIGKVAYSKYKNIQIK